MKNINFKDFEIDNKIIAPSIFLWQERKISNKWIEISQELNQELTSFLQTYINFLTLNWKKIFFRIDAYFDDKNLYILDMNASFVDWRWSALNLTRSIWQKIESLLLNYFPKSLKLQEEQYRLEFELCIKELNLLFFNEQVTWYEIPDYYEVKEIDKEKETYIYWVTNNVWEKIFPYNWIQIDNKTNLAKFSKQWRWDFVKIPEIILPSDISYQNLPKEIVLKIASKDYIRQDWRNKVFLWKPKKWWKMWEDWLLIAQEKINPTKNTNWENTQAIILTAWIESITWYVQNSTKDIINDDSVQSPLMLK